MKKTIATLVAGAAILASVMPALAKNPKGPADYNGMNHFGNASHLYLYEKDSTTWEVLEDGAWGKMTYHEDTFVFNGHKLVPGQEYSLINYSPDVWPGADSILMSNGTADEYGNIHLSGLMEGVSGKVWLVLSSDFTDGTGMTGWHPEEYLYEYTLID